MKTGARFWRLVGLALLILVGYTLAEFNDTLKAKAQVVANQRQLLEKQEALLRDTQWDKNLTEIGRIRQQWLSYLPTEKSAAVAKAHLLNELRSSAINAGITNAVTNAADSDLTHQADKPSHAQTNALPAGVHAIKIDLTGRFEPAAFEKFMRTLEERRFTTIERMSIRGTQLDINVRCYWQTDAPPTKTPS